MTKLRPPTGQTAAYAQEKAHIQENMTHTQRKDKMCNQKRIYTTYSNNIIRMRPEETYSREYAHPVQQHRQTN